ncbi:hypothetical protein QM616_19090 [Rhodococcus fascians]|uniref:hypothetical protein n=1 Tax=Rhodococcoides fascians TaxID=1828 RepID=UPI0024B85968|nr:hypothetical protein [Rhodococcus fascians]MDJ0004833.1 hypothetical protein [Rhodococcus fascians]
MLIHSALIRIADSIPLGHRHFDPAASSKPCVLCTLFFIDWYDVFVCLLVSTGRSRDVLWLARIASAIAPYTPSANSNHGLAAERSAEFDANSRQSRLAEAERAYRIAASLAPEIEMYSDSVVRAAKIGK